jgi:hypothetical protein
MKHDPDAKLPYCSYARGLAYARSGNIEAAKTDFQACLPEMIRTLRIPSGGKMFEYAENTMVRYGKGKLSDEEMVIKMINRLRLISGQDFGYDSAGTPEQKEAPSPPGSSGSVTAAQSGSRRTQCSFRSPPPRTPDTVEDGCSERIEDNSAGPPVVRPCYYSEGDWEKNAMSRRASSVRRETDSLHIRSSVR